MLGRLCLLELDFYTQLRRRFTTGDSQRIMGNPSRVMISFLLVNSPRLCSQIRTQQAILSPKGMEGCNLQRWLIFNHWVRKKPDTTIRHYNCMTNGYKWSLFQASLLIWSLKLKPILFLSRPCTGQKASCPRSELKVTCQIPHRLQWESRNPMKPMVW